jgi:hypothetical protein
MIKIEAPDLQKNMEYINKKMMLIDSAIKRAVPLSAKTIAEVIVSEKQQQLDALVGTQNKSGRTTKKIHTKMRNTIKIMKFSDSPYMSRFDITIGAPYFNWVENGSNAAFGLPWSKSRKRDFSKSVFKGYHALEIGFNNVVKNNMHIELTKAIIKNELQKSGIRVR